MPKWHHDKQTSIHSCREDRSFKTNFPFLFPVSRCYFVAVVFLPPTPFCVLIQNVCFGDLCTHLLSQLDKLFCQSNCLWNQTRCKPPTYSYCNTCCEEDKSSVFSGAMLRHCNGCSIKGKTTDHHSETVRLAETAARLFRSSPNPLHARWLRLFWSIVIWGVSVSLPYMILYFVIEQVINMK